MSESGGAVEVPHTALRPETLRAVIEEFVTRDTTDYGAREASLERKVADVMRQLERGEAKLVFDPEANAVNIVPVTRSRDGSGPGAAPTAR